MAGRPLRHRRRPLTRLLSFFARMAGSVEMRLRAFDRAGELLGEAPFYTRTAYRKGELAIVPVGTVELVAVKPCTMGQIEVTVTKERVWFEPSFIAFDKADSFRLQFRMTING